MPSKKYQRVVDSDAASFRRAHGMSSDAGKEILIVTEGVVTEPVYFEGIRRRLASLTVELVTYGAGAGPFRKPPKLGRSRMAAHAFIDRLRC